MVTESSMVVDKNYGISVAVSSVGERWENPPHRKQSSFDAVFASYECLYRKMSCHDFLVHLLHGYEHLTEIGRKHYQLFRSLHHFTIFSLIPKVSACCKQKPQKKPKVLPSSGSRCLASSSRWFSEPDGDSPAEPNMLGPAKCMEESGWIWII